MRTFVRVLAPSASLAALMALPGVAQAGGVEVPDTGTKALGRGSAFTARADDLSAFQYNVAGLSKHETIGVHVGANLINMNFEFQRGGSGELVCYTAEDPSMCDPEMFQGVWDPAVDPNTGEPYAPVNNQIKLSPAPQVVLNFGNVGGVKGLAVAAGLLTPSAFGFPDYGNDSAARYALRGANALIVLPGVSLAYRVNRYFSVGVSYLHGITHAQFNQAARGTINPNQPNRNENPEGDADFAIDVRDWASPAAQIGILSNPIDQVEIGINVRTPVRIDASGELGYTPSEDVGEDSNLTANGVSFRQALPWVIRAGARFIHKRFDLEVDYVWEGHGKTGLEGFEIDFEDDVAVNLPTLGEVPLVDVVLLKRFRDTHSVRFGSDVAVLPEVLDIRVGGWWQSSALPDNHETLSVDFPNAMQYAVTAGLTYHAVPRKKPNKRGVTRNALDLTLGYSRIFQPEITVTKGVVQQEGIRTPEIPPSGNIVNNGTYRLNYNIFGLAAEGHF